ncbi:hypothetical protein OAQ51_02650 [Gammaproteobacteria bacterium]|jgi:hypothetical protein|nr:hypothetical protein [Gammaproteobacteria bacterium]
MKKLILLPLLLTMFASAEIYEDFTPSQEPMELTVVAVQPNYVDTYLTNLNRTWVRAMNVQKKLGYVEDFNVWTSLSVADSPNVWITVQYKDLASMQPTKEKNKAVEAELEKLYGDNEVELEEISKGYEEIRKMIAHHIIYRVDFK